MGESKLAGWLEEVGTSSLSALTRSVCSAVITLIMNSFTCIYSWSPGKLVQIQQFPYTGDKKGQSLSLCHNTCRIPKPPWSPMNLEACYYQPHTGWSARSGAPRKCCASRPAGGGDTETISVVLGGYNRTALCVLTACLGFQQNLRMPGYHVQILLGIWNDWLSSVR